MKESDQWRALSSRLKGTGQPLLIVRVETATYPGFPDVVLVGRGVSAFIENKIIRGRKFQSPLTEEQVEWFEEYCKCGGLDSWIIAFGSENIFIWPGKHARRVRDAGIDAPGRMDFPRPVDANVLLDTILGEQAV